MEGKCIRGSNSIDQISGDTLWLKLTNSGMDTLQAIFTNPCSNNIRELIVEVNIGLTVDLGPDTLIHPDSTLALNTGAGFQSCIWQDGSRDSIYTVTQQGLYWATCVDECGNTSTDTIQVCQMAIEMAHSYDDCLPGADQTWCAQIRGGMAPYQYNWQGLSSSTDSCTTTDNQTDGDMVLTITDADGCSQTVSLLNYQFPRQPNIVLDTVQFSITGQEDGILAVNHLNPSTGTLSYQWNTGATTATLFNLSAGTYTVTVTSPAGCMETASAVLTELGMPLFPNVFTPNDDGNNDVFRLINVPDGDVEQFRVFNRWGQVVLDAAGGIPAWDGTYKGVPQPTDVYLYHIHYRSGGTLIEQRGELTLLR